VALFKMDQSSNNSIKTLRTKGDGHVKFLEGATDISKLEILHTGRIWGRDYFHNNGTYRFEYLKDLSVDLCSRHRSNVSVLQDFLKICNPLECLSLKDHLGRLLLSRILARHGNTLTQARTSQNGNS
jgi:hypothetical protein